MKKMTMVLAVAGILSLTGLAQAGDPWNNYVFTLNSTASTITYSVDAYAPVPFFGTVKIGSGSGSTHGQGPMSATLWQSGSSQDNFSQVQVTDLNLTTTDNPVILTISGLGSGNATAHNLNIQDMDDSSSYSHPVGMVDGLGNFILTQFGTNSYGTVDYNVSVLGINKNGTADLADYNPHFNDIKNGYVIKSGGQVKLSMDLDVSGRQDLSTYYSGMYADYHIISHLETLLTPIKSVLPGDANCDHVVDVSDLGILAANYGGSGKTWTEGNFSYGDSLVDVSDLGILAAHYGTSGGAVPEPLTLSLLVFGGIGLLRKRG